MKFGVSYLPDSDDSTKSAECYYQDIIRLSVLAEQLNFDYIKMTEHYMHAYGGYCPSPLSFLSAVATVTRKIRLMTGCVLPVFHHPLQLASHTAMVDVISGGRLDVGFARAYLPYEFDAFEIPMDESRERFCKTIETVIDLWTKPTASADTPFFQFEDVGILPKTVQNPHPPVWGAAVMSRESFAWLGEKGFNLLVTPPPAPIEKLAEKIDIYRESLAEHHPDKKPNIAISLPIYVAENEETARSEGSMYLKKYIDVWHKSATYWNNRQSSNYPGYSALADILGSLTPEMMMDHKQALLGNSDTVAEQLQYISKTLGVQTILCQIEFGSQPYECIERTLSLLGNEVIPACNSLNTGEIYET